MASASSCPPLKQFKRKKNLRIASIQFSPLHSDPVGSVGLVEKVIADSNLEPGTLDLLVLPELALTGYVFDSKKDIQPLLEDVNQFQTSISCTSQSSKTAPTSYSASSSSSPTNVSLNLARNLSSRLNTNVIVGFPEIRKSSQPSPSSHQSSGPIDSRPKDLVTNLPSEHQGTYNSAALFSRKGQLLKVFSKHFLFKDDERWCKEGEGFEWIDLEDLGRICVAICMDLNPYRFESPFQNFELSLFCSKNKVDLLAIPMAWLLSSEEVQNSDELEGQKPSVETINYWAWRSEGIWGGEVVEGEEVGETIFVASNRVGKEGESTFAGSSCVLRLPHPGSKGSKGQPQMLGCLGKSQTGLLNVQVKV